MNGSSPYPEDLTNSLLFGDCVFFWICVFLASDSTAKHGSKGKEHKKAHQASCATCECRIVCAERRWMPGAAAGREKVHREEEQTNTGEQDTKMKEGDTKMKEEDTKMKEQAVEKTNIKERSLWKTRAEQWKWREGGRRKRGREERPLCAWEKDNKSCGLLSRRTIPALFTVCSFNLVNF